MPTNKGKGGKSRQRGKNENESAERELVFEKDGQEYAQVIKVLGNGPLDAMCFDDYQGNKADVILKYSADEARRLKAYGEIPERARINATDTFGCGGDDEIQFDDIGDDDEHSDDIEIEPNILHSSFLEDCPTV
ncbi:Eukaryotic translation initiation factor 1A, X-chromosomal [Fukomys damarensis]|uniref:Eukaryotic translation initiation factor 1A, X-chromosomal n=1 Tax=Fukomys damarensis TaxID=885580 RepID=A0A091CUM8_FUKDA|nr:Eukaryotic translation initiation factor 1A, X-chromosomal [Fukomys damarensis]